MVSDSKTSSAEHGQSNHKLISTNSGFRVSQACDRCRIKKIKCDGLTPCKKCSTIGIECKTSDKLTRRAFPKGYTENLEVQVKQLEEENKRLKLRYGEPIDEDPRQSSEPIDGQIDHPGQILNEGHDGGQTNNDGTNVNEKQTMRTSHNTTVQINNPIDQIFNLDKKGIIIGNDNLNFESQFNHLLINLNLPFLKITNSHNYLLNDPDSYLYHPSYTSYNRFHNKDLDVIYNPLTSNNSSHDDYLHELSNITNNELPMDIYDLFIKLINNFKKMFNSKKELDNQVTNFFLNYNVFIPIFDYKQFMESYDNFHTMYPFMFTYDDATINGFNILNNDYHIVNEFLMVVIQLYAMIMMNDPTINLNLLLNHQSPHYSSPTSSSTSKPKSVIRSLYDFLPYFNVFHISIQLLQTYLLFLYFSLLTNNKEKSLVLSSLVNAFIGVLGINLNSRNLFFNDLSLNVSQKRDRIKIFWAFKVLLKCFNLKFGFKPSLNTTVINPITIDRYFQLTPEKLSLLLDTNDTNDDNDHQIDELFRTLLKPSVEFLNLVNIIIPSSFSPNYYQYLKSGHNPTNNSNSSNNNKRNPKNLDWILNDHDGDGNDGNLNYNTAQFLTIDKNLSNWRYSLQEKSMNLLPLSLKMNLPNLNLNMGLQNNSVQETNLYHRIRLDDIRDINLFGITQQGMDSFSTNGVPDVDTAGQLIKIQLNFHYLLIRALNYLNFIVDKELSNTYYNKISKISQEILYYFILIFRHVSRASELGDGTGLANSSGKNQVHHNPHSTGTNPVIMNSLGLDVDEDGFVVNDFLAKRRKTGTNSNSQLVKLKQVPVSPFNSMLNGLSITVINIKKTIILQMLYSLICSIRSFKRGDNIDEKVFDTLSVSTDLFIKVFINYQLNSNTRKNNVSGKVNKLKEDELYNKLMNDELKDQILREQRNDEEGYLDYELGFDNEHFFGDFNEISDIDWDDEDMDEDLKYLKILKFIKYKMNQVIEMNRKIIERKEMEALNKQSSTPTGTLQPTAFDNAPRPKLPAIVGGMGGVGATSIPSRSNSQSSQPLPPPPSITNFYTTASPNSRPQPLLPKMPSISKLDYILPDENFPTHTISTPITGNRNSDDIRREKLAVNELMSMKNHGSPGFWNYKSQDTP